MQNEIYIDRYQPPVFNFLRTTEKENLFFGIELEVNSEIADENSNAKLITSYVDTLDYNNIIYCKHDCTLAAGGVEIVSHPMSLQFFKRGNIFNNLLPFLLANRFYVNDKCGLHIHANESFLTTYEINTLRMFFSENQDILHIYSKRSCHNYFMYEYENLILDTYIYTKGQRIERNGINGYNRHDSRYFAVHNNSIDKPTIEFRIFASTLDYTRLVSILEFCHAILHCVKKLTVEDFANKNTWNKFMLFLNKKEYITVSKELQCISTVQTVTI